MNIEQGVIVFATLLILRWVHLYGDRAFQQRGMVSGPFLQVLQYGSFVAILGSALLECGVFERFSTTWVVWFVVASIGCTQVFKLWAHIVLGQYWSPHVEIRQGQPLVERGPYRFMRHPSYLNGILEAVLAPLLVGAWVTSALAALVVFFVFRSRILAEEQRMLQHFGIAYRDYCCRVPRFGVRLSVRGFPATRDELLVGHLGRSVS